MSTAKSRSRALLSRALLCGGLVVAILNLAPRESEAAPNDPLFHSSFLVIRESVRPEGPHPLAIGDVNNDHAPDLVVVRSGLTGPYANVAIYFGDGYGNFSKPVSLDGAIPRSVWGVNVSDLNRDGRLDLIFSSTQDTSIWVRMGRGDGNFDPMITSASRYLVNSVSVGDMNEDGTPDLVVGQGPFGSGYCILSGDGTGRFAMSYRGGTVNMAQSILTDMDRDGHLDIVGADITYVAGDGLGGILEERYSGYAGWGNSVAVADLDGDGNKDIITGDVDDRRLFVRYSTAGGQFDGSRDYRFDIDGGVRSILARDLDGDGHAEIITGGPSVRIYGTDGSGRLQLRRELPATGSNPAIECADLNADGRPDIVAASTEAIGVYLTGPDLMFPVAPSTMLDSRPGPAVSGEFSGDSNADVAVLLPSANAVDVLNGRPDGLLVPASRVPVGAGPRSIVRADLDLDGRDDLVVTDALDAKITILKQLPDHSWQRTDVPGVAGMPWLAVTDLDLDGWPDLVTQDGNTQEVDVLRGSAASPGAPTVVASPGWAGVSGAFADFDGDGDADLMLVRSDGEARFLERASATVLVPRTTFYPSSSPWPITAATTFDFDQDGRPDGIVSGRQGFTIIHNTGSSTFNGGGWHSTGIWEGYYAGVMDMAFANLEADGAMDLVATLDGRPSVPVFRLNPAVDLEENVWAYGFGPTNPEHNLLADVTGDGLLDLVVTDPDSQRVWVAPHVSAPSTGVGDPRPDRLSATLAFRGSVPNPVHGERSMLRFEHLVPGPLRIEILDARGRIIRRLFDGTAIEQATSFAWDGRDNDGMRVTAGVYFARALQGRSGQERRIASGKVVVLP